MPGMELACSFIHPSNSFVHSFNKGSQIINRERTKTDKIMISSYKDFGRNKQGVEIEDNQVWGEALYSEWKVETPTLRSAGWQGASPSEQRGEFLSRGVSSGGRRCGSVAQSCLTLCNPWTVARQPSLSLTISQSLLKLMSIESVMTPNHLILFSPSPPALSLFQHQGLFK